MEITVVIVIIAILAIGSIPFVSRAQADARDDRRETDIAVIAAALESYYQDNGEYPAGQGSSRINPSWSATVDGSWSNLRAKLVPKYVSELPLDPSEDDSKTAMSGGNAYEYYANGSSWCGKGRYQMYILLYNFESRARKETFIGDCSTTPLKYDGASNYRVARDNT